MNRRIITSLVLLGLMLAQSLTAFAEGERKNLKEFLFEKGILTKEEAALIQEAKLTVGIDRLSFSGDFRLRQESMMKDPARDRHRQRFRLRFGSEIKVQDVTAGIRLASGTGEQISTNQSFDNLSAQKTVAIDRAYIKWQGADSRWLTLTGGRMPNPFFTVYSTDTVWDEDFNPEGFAENMSWKPDGQTTVFFNMGQIVLDEDSADNNDQWLFGQQVGTSFVPKQNMTATMALAYYDATNVKKSNFGQTACQSGNTRAVACTGSPDPGRLLNDYNVVDLTVQIGMKAGSLPLSVMGDYVRNLSHPKTISGQEAGDSGYQTGFILGKASDPQTWEVAYFYKVLETDATLADISDSDFGDGGTNRKGHIVWGAYNPNRFLQCKVKFFSTQVEVGLKDDIDRVQADLSLKF